MKPAISDSGGIMNGSFVNRDLGEIMLIKHTAYLNLLLAISFIVFSGCAGLPENSNRTYTYTLTGTKDTKIGRLVAKEQVENLGKSGFFLLDNGLDAYVARAVLSEAAERSLDLQYYLYHNDVVGNLLGHSILKAADRGVRVRLLVDDMGLAGRDISIATLASHPNIEIRIFNPFSRKYFRVLQFLTRFGDVTRRMHNKSFTVDNNVTIVGGRNIGNEYFDADPSMAFGDLDVIAIGQVVNDVSQSFDEYWNSPLSYPIETLRGAETSLEDLNDLRPEIEQYVKEQEESAYYEALLHSNLANTLREERELRYIWGNAKAIYDRPEKITEDTSAKELHLAPQLSPVIDSIENELIILTAYFVPGRKGVKFLKSLVERGVKVRILTNSLSSTDVSLVHAGYSKYRKALLRAGVELHELKKKLSQGDKDSRKAGRESSKASLHAKAFIIDREKLFIGSLNLDPRSFDQNTEIGIIFEAPEMAENIGERFDAGVTGGAYNLALQYDEDLGYDTLRWNTIENGKKKVYLTEPNVSFLQKLLLGLAILLPIESQL